MEYISKLDINTIFKDVDLSKYSHLMTCLNSQEGTCFLKFISNEESLDEVIKNQEKFQQELEKLNNELTQAKTFVNDGINALKTSLADVTTSGMTIPKAGNSKLFIALAFVFVITIVLAIRYIRYRDVK